jgi:hypothetical protein
MKRLFIDKRLRSTLTPSRSHPIRARAPISNHPLIRCYHSYPDPNEKPVVSQALSTASRSLDKSNQIFQLDKKFRLDEAFPGIKLGQGSNASTYPETRITRLQNGITVASQDLPSSLMSSFAVIIDAGRYSVVIFLLSFLDPLLS